MQTISDIPELKPRAIDGHKGDYGKVCIIGGSLGMSGAGPCAASAPMPGQTGSSDEVEPLGPVIQPVD